LPDTACNKFWEHWLLAVDVTHTNLDAKLYYVYRPLRQTQDHIYSVRTICEKFIDKGKDVYFAFLDLKAAFDLIPRQVIWEALAREMFQDL
jgi:hypothetical protein